MEKARRNRELSPARVPGSVTGPLRLVVFAVGNESRGDDGMGPALLARLEGRLPAGAWIVPGFQLQVEDALELREAELALFIDAAVGLTDPFAFYEIEPSGARSAFSHALAPSAVLEVFSRIEGRAPPPAFALALRATRFGLGEALSASARADLDAAFSFAAALLANPTPAFWRRRARERDDTQPAG